MTCVIAVLMAALSFLLNRAALRCVGAKAVISLSPALEEAAKTIPAYYLGADIFFTHVIFGVVEAGYDWRTGRRHGPPAAFLSVAGHGLFGFATAGVLYLTGSLWLAVASTAAVHIAWNVAAIRLTAGKETK